MAIPPNNIKNLRLQKKTTQEHLAVVIGVSRQTIIAIEKGNCTPSLLLAFKLAKYFKQPIEEIFFRDAK